MEGPADKEFLKNLFIRFGILANKQDRNTAQLLTVVKLGGAIIVINEWYDMHNQRPAYIKTWRTALEVLHTAYDIHIDDVPALVQQASTDLLP